MWVVGDEFVARSGDIIEKKVDTYVHENFQVRAMGGSSITSRDNPDPIARLRNIIIKLLNKFNTIPKIIVVVAENDIIKAINVEDSSGYSVHYGQAIEWIIDGHVDIMDKYKGYIQKNAKKGRRDWPYYMWISPSLHEQFEDYNLRRKFTKCLEKIAHGDRNIIAMRLMKQIWDQKDVNLVNNQHRFTTEGYNTYWSAVDHAIKYMDEKIIPSMVEKNKENKYFSKRVWSETDRRTEHRDDRKNNTAMDRRQREDRRSTYDRTHWRREPHLEPKLFGHQHKRENSNDRRKLPTPPAKKH